MSLSTRTRADDVRALASAIVLGSSAGLFIGAAYLASSGSKPAARPVPAVSGSLQAAVHSAPNPVAAATPPAAALRDRFRVASEGVHSAAQPFRFTQVADAPTDLHCLAEAVYFEARGEAADGQQAVAQVVLNRVRHPAFPKTICAVVHQHSGSGCQFTFACSGQQAALDSLAWRRAESIASSEMHGAVMTAVGDATHFQASRESPFAGLMRVAQIGAHVFYRFGGHAGAPAMFHQAPAASAATGKVEVARLDEAPAIAAAQPIAGGERIKVTLYPGAPTAAPARVQTPTRLAAGASTPGTPVAAPDHTPAVPPSVAAPTLSTPVGKPVVLAVALAQS